jgi:hypothetical protein
MCLKHRRRVILAACVSLLTWLIVGCGGKQETVSDPTAQFETAVALVSAATAQATSLATPMPPPTAQPASPTVEPQPTSDQDTGEEAPLIETLCLQIDQSYPEIEEDFSLPIQEAAEEILSEMGLTVMETGGACDATLDIDFVGEAYWVTFENTGRCYNGAEVTGRATLALSGEESEWHSIRGVNPIPLLSFYCQQTPAHAPWDRAWAGALLDGLVAFWGPIPVLERAIRHHEVFVRQEAAKALITVGGEGVPLLVQALDDESYEVRKEAADSLGEVGPEAVEAVPALIMHLRDTEGEPLHVQWACGDALRDITGEHYGDDPDAYQAWWDAQQQP